MQITRNAALNQVNEYFVGWTRPVIIFNSRKIDDNVLIVFFLLLYRTSTSCATGQHWSTWGALTTMQRNHSHRAPSPVRPLRSVPSVPSQPPSNHLIPPSPRPHPAKNPIPSQLPEGRRKGWACRPVDVFYPITEIHAELTNHLRFFCFKIIKHYSDYWQLWQLLYRPDGADWQLASLLRRSQSSLIVKGYW